MSTPEKKKYKRRVVGSVLKDKNDPKVSYIKMREDVVLKGGEIIRLESKKQQLASLEAAMAAGKITEEMGNTIKERIEKIPDWVLFELVKLTQS